MKSSISYPIYSDPDFVEKYARALENNAWNAYYERPATMSLLPELDKKKVLDAGSGPGVVSELMTWQGAIVTSIDYSEEMIRRVTERLGDKAEAFVFDMNHRFSLFMDSVFDVIYCSLVIHYIDDLELLFSEFSRILKPEGLLIFSTDHPENPDFKDRPVTEKRLNEVPWGGYNIKMQVIERPWEEIISALTDNHFVTEIVLEPKPTEDCRIHFPREYDYLKNNPHFICVRVKNLKSE